MFFMLFVWLLIVLKARVAAGGRNWEGLGGDPYLAGEMAAQNVMGIQSEGVVRNIITCQNEYIINVLIQIACAKHYIGNEQEHYRQTVRTLLRRLKEE